MKWGRIEKKKDAAQGPNDADITNLNFPTGKGLLRREKGRPGKRKMLLTKEASFTG